MLQLNFDVMTLATFLFDVATLIFSFLLTSVDVVTLKSCSDAFNRCCDIGYPMSRNSSSGVATLKLTS